MAERIVNDLTRGMVRKVNPLKKEQNFYNFALNISPDVARSDRLTKISERKLEDYFNLKNIDYVILNALYINVDEYVYFITDKISSFSEILYYNKGAITTLYNNQGLNFNAGYIISSTFRVAYNGDRIVYFVDGYNKDRVINIDKIQLTDSLESISINPVYTNSDYLKYSINSNGGTLRVGNYSVFISYNDLNDKESNFKEYIENIHLGNGKYSDLINATNTQAQNYANRVNFDVYGLPEGSSSNKSIIIYPKQNSNYKSINIYVVLKLNTTTEVFLQENVTIDESFVISDLNNFISLGNDISTVIVNNIIYNYSETLVQKDNRLLLANTKPEGHNIDFQSIANQITVTAVNNKTFFDGTRNTGYELRNYITGSSISSQEANFIQKDKESISEPNYLGYTQSTEVPAMSFMRDDVYALGVYFELDNGIFTDVYHIPGRLPNIIPAVYNNGTDENNAFVNTSQFSTWDTRQISINGEVDQAWRIMNTSIKHQNQRQALLGYHRTNTAYPEGYGFPTNGEQNSQGRSYIRHHRIPSDLIFPLIESTNTSLPADPIYKRERNFVNLRFDNINIPSELQDKIKKVYFCIADRDEYNKKVIDKGLIYSLRSVNDRLRNSELLNNPVLFGDKSNRNYEFISPNIDFNFKQFNIKADKIKINSIISGSVGYMIKRYSAGQLIGGGTGDLGTIRPIAFLNAEGVSTSNTELVNIAFDYKQEVTLSRVFYNDYRPRVGLYQRRLEDNVFIDNNSVTNIGGDTIAMEGSQNTSILRLADAESSANTNLLPNDSFTTFVSNDYKNRAGTTQSGVLSGQFYFEGSNVNPNVGADRGANRNDYFDSTEYVTLLSDNNELFTNLLQLTYTRIVGNNNFYQGDCYIENHHTKKSYSTKITNPNYRVIKALRGSQQASGEYRVSDGLDYMVVGTNNDGWYIDWVNNVETAVSESYITYTVETRMDIRMRRQDGTNDHFPYTIFKNSLPYNTLEKKVLSQETYILDNQFRNNKGVNTLFSNSTLVNDLNNLSDRIGHRIIYSELQNNESLRDNFRNFLANNYKDIQTNKGDIHKLFVKNNNLYILTKDSLFVINSSNNFLSTRNGNEVYVGTGEFLGTNAEELISLETGFAGTSSKLSFNENKYGYFFVDIIRNKTILFNEGLNDINILGLEEDFTLNLLKAFPELDTELDKPLLGYGILSGFDNESDRLFITKLDYKPTELMLSEFGSNISIQNGLFYRNGILLDFSNSDYFENKSFTVTYDCMENKWISYHTYFPNYYIPNPNILVLKEQSIQKYGNKYTDNFIIDVLFNENQGITKVFDSIQFDVNSETYTGESTEEFFDSIIVYNKYQSTGLVVLNPDYPRGNITRKETYWNFSNMLDISTDKLNKKLFLSDWNSIKNNYYIDKVVNDSEISTNKDWYKKKRFRDKYINVRLFKNNLENQKFSINFAILNYRPSIR